MARTKSSPATMRAFLLRQQHRSKPMIKPLWPHERGRPNRTNLKAPTTSKSARSVVLWQHPCSFLNIPRELRDKIYSLLLPSYTTLNFAAPTWTTNAAGQFFDIRYNMAQRSLIVLALCRQIRAEANALLYGTNHFEFAIGYWTWPSPYNTIRALPRSGITQIKSCTFHLSHTTEKQHIRLMKKWMEELCGLLKQGGNLQEITIEVENCFGIAGPSDLVKFESVLKPFERLGGLKSAVVKDLGVTEAYRATFKKVLEDDGIRMYKKRRTGTVDVEEVVLRPRKRY